MEPSMAQSLLVKAYAQAEELLNVLRDTRFSGPNQQAVLNELTAVVQLIVTLQRGA